MGSERRESVGVREKLEMMFKKKRAHMHVSEQKKKLEMRLMRATKASWASKWLHSCIWWCMCHVCGVRPSYQRRPMWLTEQLCVVLQLFCWKNILSCNWVVLCVQLVWVVSVEQLYKTWKQSCTVKIEEPQNNFSTTGFTVKTVEKKTRYYMYRLPIKCLVHVFFRFIFRLGNTVRLLYPNRKINRLLTEKTCALN